MPQVQGPACGLLALLQVASGPLAVTGAPGVRKETSKSEVPWPRGRAWVLAVAPRLRGRALRITEPSVDGRSCYGRAWPCHLFGCGPESSCGLWGKCSRGVPQALTRLRLTLVSTERGETGRRGGDGGMARTTAVGGGEENLCKLLGGSLAPPPSGSRWPRAPRKALCRAKRVLSAWECPPPKWQHQPQC